MNVRKSRILFIEDTRDPEGAEQRQKIKERKRHELRELLRLAEPGVANPVGLVAKVEDVIRFLEMVCKEAESRAEKDGEIRRTRILGKIHQACLRKGGE